MKFQGYHTNQAYYKSGCQPHPGATSAGDKPGNY